MSITNIRALAAGVLADLETGKGSLGSHLAEIKGNRGNASPGDIALLQEILYGCCRWFYLLEYITTQLLSKPLKRKDNDLKCLLIIGLYQLRSLSVPEYAVLNETVAAASVLGKPWGKALINAVLRNYLRERDSIEKSLLLAPSNLKLSHPEWLFSKIQKQWPQQCEQIVSANNSRPPLTLRANLARTTRRAVLAELLESGFDATEGRLAPSAIYLDTPTVVDALPGFAVGKISVQDEASQMVPGLLQLAPGLRVLDACAAPGGKTCHLLESEPSLTGCTALDIDAGRLGRISENLNRLGLKANLVVADAAAVAQWWDGQTYDRILLDAPCSATGVIRRHPDIKLLRTQKNVNKLMQTQHALLHNLWQCLSPGGLLLYTSCSILHEENEELIARFLEATATAKYESIAADWGVECRYGRQLLPNTGNEPDGFYYALLRKI